MTVVTKFPTGIVSNAGFTSPTNIEVADSVQTSIGLAPGDTGGISVKFGFSIPTGSIISNVQIKAINWTVSDPSLALSLQWSNSLNQGFIHNFVSANDTFDVTSEDSWTPNELSDADGFIVSVAADATNASFSTTATIDAVSVQVTYSAPTIIALTSSNKVVSSPTLGTPTLSSFGTPPLVVGSPTIGTPTLGLPSKTYYVLNTNAVTPNWFGLLQDGGSAPADALCGFGFGPRTTPLTTPYYRGNIGSSTINITALAASYVDAATGPIKGSSLTITGDSFIAPAVLSGSFDNTAWTFNWKFAPFNAGAVGRIRMRVWASVNADGTSARELTSGALLGSIATLSATVVVSSTISWSPGAMNINNEYLFFQLEWQETTLGTSTAAFVFDAGASISTANWTANKFIIPNPVSVVVGSPAISLPTIGIVSTNCTANNLIVGSPAISVAAIGQKHILPSTILVVGSPALDTPSLGKIFSSSSLAVGSPAFIAPSLTGSPITASSSIVASPSLGSPSLGEIFSATNLVVGSPAIAATAAINQTQVLPVSSLAVGSPVYSAPIIEQKDILSSVALAVGSPSIGGPDITNTSYSVAFGLNIGLPVIGSPTLAILPVAIQSTSLVVSSPHIGTPMRWIIDIAPAPLVVSGPLVGIPTVGADLSSSSLIVASPAVASPTMAVVVHCSAVSNVVGSPVFGFVSSGNQVVGANLVVNSPTIGTPSTAQIPNIIGIGISPISLEIDSPGIGQHHVLPAQALIVASPVIQTPSTAATIYHFGSPGLVVGLPSIGSPTVNPEINLLPVSLSSVIFGGVDFGKPAINQKQIFTNVNSLMVGIPQITAPTLSFYDPSPAVVCLTHQDDGEQEALFTNTNVDFGLIMGPLSLAGRTEEGVGPAEAVTVTYPLILKSSTLGVDLSTVSDSIASLRADLNTLISEVASNYVFLFDIIAQLGSAVRADMVSDGLAVTRIPVYMIPSNVITIGPNIGAPTFVPSGPQQLIVGSPKIGTPALDGPDVPPPIHEFPGGPGSLVVGSPTIGVPNFAHSVSGITGVTVHNSVELVGVSTIDTLVVTTPVSNIKAGSMIVVTVIDCSGIVGKLQDTSGNYYIPVNQIPISVSGHTIGVLSMWYVPSCIALNTQSEITYVPGVVTGSFEVSLGVVSATYDGIITIDQNISAGGIDSLSMSISSGIPSSSGEFWIAGVGDCVSRQSDTFSQPPGWLEGAKFTSVSNGLVGQGGGYLIASKDDALSKTYAPIISPSRIWSMILLGFKIA